MLGLKMSLDAVVGYISQVVIYVLFSGTTADGRLQAAQERRYRPSAVCGLRSKGTAPEYHTTWGRCPHSSPSPEASSEPDRRRIYPLPKMVRMPP